MNVYIKNILMAMLLVWSFEVHAGTPQWCINGDTPCADTPEEVCRYWMDIYSAAGKCSKEYHGITKSDQYGALEAACDIKWGKDATGVCPPGSYTTAVAKRMWLCPAGTQMDPVSGVCTKYALAEGEGGDPPQQCGLNPIAFESGMKLQMEEDIPQKSKGGVSFSRFYTSQTGQWHHNYELTLKSVDPYAQEISFKNKSSNYPSKADACVQGWAEIRGNISASWAVGATAQLNGDSCQIIKNGAVARVLPLIPENPRYIRWIPGEIHLIRPNGSSFSFQYADKLDYHPINGIHGTIKRTPLDYLAPANAVAWVFTDNTNQVEQYSAEGKLLSVISPSNIKQTLTYDSGSGLLSQVQDSVGHSLTLIYTNNALSSIVADASKTTSYSYNSTGLINDVKRPDNTHRLYHYEDTRFPNFLTGITDERSVRYATWTYDAQGRTITSQHAGGVEFGSLTYNADGSTTLTDALGKQTIYRFADISGARRVTSVEGQPTTNCVGANKNYTYTPEGWVASKTDWNGNKTTYQYNANGQEISRTEAADTSVAKTYITEWHPTLSLKTKVTEPGKETIYTYDANGLLSSKKTRSTGAHN